MAHVLPRLLIASLLIGLGCGELLARGGQPSIQEISSEEARRRVAKEGAILLQPRPLEAGEVLVPEALAVFEDDPLDEAWQNAPALVVVGKGTASWGLAARLARTQDRTVAITPGEPEAWPGPRSARKESRPGI